MLVCVQPLLGEQAAEIGLVNRVLCDVKSQFVGAVELAARQLRYDHAEVEKILAQKQAERTPQWFAQVEEHRARELTNMKTCFTSPEYIDARRGFVLKEAATATPPHLLHPWPVVNAKNALVLEACWDGAKAGEVSSAAKFVHGAGTLLRSSLLDDQAEATVASRFPIE